MTEPIWEQVPAEIAPVRTAFEIKVVLEEPEEVGDLAEAAEEYGLGRARLAARLSFVERLLQGPHAAGGRAEIEPR